MAKCMYSLISDGFEDIGPAITHPDTSTRISRPVFRELYSAVE
jgi:hypothetical protein